jgi:hypothetical protein
MSQTQSQGASAPAQEKINPHCADFWPESAFDDLLIVRLAKASEAAGALGRLLRADWRIAADLREMESDEDSPRPFDDFMTSGLFEALSIVLSEIQIAADGLQIREKKEGPSC